jgi:hypothetical protein
MDSAQIRNFQVITENAMFLNRFDGGKVLLLSPNLHDFLFWRNLLPRAEFTISTISDWNLENNFHESKFALSCGSEFDQKKFKIFDLTIAQNVFMYIKNPTRVAKNIASISDNLYLQDIKYRRRSSATTGLGTDDDISRYSITKDLVNHPRVHMLSEIFESATIITQLEYEGATNDYHTSGDTPRHILALLQLAHRNSYTPISRIYSKKSILRLFFRTFKSEVFSKFYFTNR